QMATIKGLITESKSSTIALGDALDAISQRGTGRPTATNATLLTDPIAATAGDLVTKSVTAPVTLTLDEALKLTEKTDVAGTGTCRVRPAGVGKDVRPPLTSEQKSLMDIRSILGYVEGGQAVVPDI